MEDNLIVALRRNAPLLTGLTAVLGILIFTFGDPETAYYPIHDFLDHTVTLSAVWTDHHVLFLWLRELPFIMGGSVPSGALGISDFSLPEQFQRFLSTPLALGIIQISGRTVSFLIAFALYVRLTTPQSAAGKWAAAASGVSLALMPYWPVMTWIIAGAALTILSLVNLYQGYLRRTSILLLALAPHLAYFAWGGFLQPLIAFVFLIVALISRARAFPHLAYGVLASTTSSILSAGGLIATWASPAFESHRLSWPVREIRWFSIEALAAALREGGPIFLGGSTQFGTFFQTSSAGIPYLVNASVVGGAIFLSASSIILLKIRTSQSSVAEEREIKKVVKILLGGLALQLLAAGLFVAERVGLTDFKALLELPFQVSRVIALSPIFWALIAGAALHLALLARSSISALLGPISIVLLIIHAVAVNPSTQSKFLSLTGANPSSAMSTFVAYFEPEAYQRVLELLPEGNNSVISFGLDPMVATYHGLTSVDGYVYNYPLGHKEKFFSIIDQEIRDTPKESYFLDWGSRAYLFDQGVEPERLKFNWCAAEEIGADFVLSDRALPNLPGLIQVDDSAKDRVNIYRIVC